MKIGLDIRVKLQTSLSPNDELTTLSLGDFGKGWGERHFVNSKKNLLGKNKRYLMVHLSTPNLRNKCTKGA